MTKHDDGGPAYPEQVPDTPTSIPGIVYNATIKPGMTLLDYYAGQALATMVESWAGSDSKYAGDVARKCYSFADAMITEKNRREAESD